MVVLAQQSEVYQLSDKSTQAVPDNFFHVTEFILGAGIVVIQPSTGKIFVVGDEEERCFFPKGRQDKGESLDKTALREGYEEVRMSTPNYPPSLSDYLIPLAISYHQTPRHARAYNQVIRSGLSLCIAEVSPRTYQRPANAPKQGIKHLPPALARVSSGIPEKTQNQSQLRSILSRWERRISDVLVCRTDTRRCGESYMFSDGMGVRARTFNIESLNPEMEQEWSSKEISDLICSRSRRHWILRIDRELNWPR